MAPAGQIVVLNGAPRSGKTSIARALQAASPEPWLNLGVDAWVRAALRHHRPGIGLRPGGERPDLEPVVEASYLALYDAVAATARRGLHVVADVEHHDRFSRPLRILPRVARRLADLPVLLVGVRCPIEEIMRRRDADPVAHAAGGDDGAVPTPVARWQDAVHDPGIYDLEVDTSTATPASCAGAILDRLAAGRPGDALRRVLEADERGRRPAPPPP